MLDMIKYCYAVYYTMCNEKYDEKCGTSEEKEDGAFDPILGEIVADDVFSFTLLSCHCSKCGD